MTNDGRLLNCCRTVTNMKNMKHQMNGKIQGLAFYFLFIYKTRRRQYYTRNYNRKCFEYRQCVKFNFNKSFPIVVLNK